MNIFRFLSDPIVHSLRTAKKIIVLFGARQTGKTTLARDVLEKLSLKTLSVNADQLKYIEILSSRDAEKIKSLVSGYEILFIDEAQRIPELGLNLKIIHDEIPEIKVLVTGSSSLELASKISEPLTGRKIVYSLFPVSVMELKKMYNPFEINEKLESLLVYGSYPEVITSINNQDKRKVLEEISSSYLFKDIFELLNLRHRSKFYDLLRLLAFQVGSEVSIHELSKNLKLNRETIEKYLRLMEDTFIIYKLGGYNRNLRKEISKMNKYYFCDLGIRNFLIDNFNPLNARNDLGQIWENFIIMERIKYLAYTENSARKYFWRTYTGAELDYLEESGGRLTGYEIKYSKSRQKAPKSFTENYSGEYLCINKENYLGFVS